MPTVLSAPVLLLAGPTAYTLGTALALLLRSRPSVARWAGGVAGMAGGVAGVGAALPILLDGATIRLELFHATPFAPIGLRLDPLAAWFVLFVSIVAFAVSLAGLGYGRAYDQNGGPRLAATTGVFLASMVMVVLADTAFTFLLAWEVMSLASYVLVVHEHDAHPSVERVGYIYLTMTHLGTAFLVAAFLTLFTAAGDLGFEAFRLAVAGLAPWLRDLIFLLALVGLATKAGVIPLHVWLPRAHPVAPSHISALMSGVMLKTAIYGLIRLTWDILGGGPVWWGGLVLALGLVSAVLGVLYALMEDDLKRLLAFSSVENVGIILIGVGAGLAAGGLGQPEIAGLALAAGLFHALNHALFKALLFLGAGAIHHATGTKDLDKLGGLIRRMPATAALFLVGSAAISSLPFLNGFASEWLTFQALLGLGAAAPTPWIAVGAGLAAGLLGLTGALAAACFVKAFGVAFLALPRSDAAAGAHEAPGLLLAGMGMLAAACALLGLLPGLALCLLGPVVASLGGVSLAMSPAPGLVALQGLNGTGLNPSLVLGLLLALGAILFLSGRLLGPVVIRRGPTWACGFALDQSMQYGALAFAKPLRLFFRVIVRPERAIEAEYADSPYFLTRLRYQAGIRPVFEQGLYRPLLSGLIRTSKRVREIQSGHLRLYLAYIFTTLVLLLLMAR